MSIFEQLRVLDDRDPPMTLRFGSTGLPMWPFVRWYAVSAAQELALGLQPAFAPPRRRAIGRLARWVARSMAWSPLSVRRSFDVVIVANPAGLVLRRQGKWFDRINDYFAAELPERTLVLDIAGPHGHRSPRFPAHVRCFETFDILASVAARLRRPAAADLVAIDRLIEFVRDAFPVAMPVSVLEHARAQLVHWAVRLPVLRELYARMFDRVRPRVLAIENASYGTYTHVCTWARAAGIVTVELQHGVISRNHLAYNVGDVAAAEPMFAYALPQYLLAYGEFWRGEVRTPVELVTVGCPHFSETASERAVGEASERVIVTISQGIRTEAMVEVTGALARRFPDRRFVFRLHPGEVAFRDRYAPLAAFDNVEISDRGDIYDLLHRAERVIGHSSTALVEAAGIGVPVLVLDDEASRAILPHDIGTWFGDAEQLAAAIDDPPGPAVDPSQFFAAGWRERYRSFVARVAGEPL